MQDLRMHSTSRLSGRLLLGELRPLQQMCGRIMKFSRSIRSGVLGIIALLMLVGTGINACEDKLSKQLDNVDPTNEEMAQAIPFAAEVNR
jgi:hypothetical protein